MSALVDSGEAVKDVTTITAVVLAEFKPENFPEEFIRDGDLTVCDFYFRPAILRFLHVSSLFCDLFLHGCFDLL